MRVLATTAILLASAGAVRAGFLFSPADPSPNGFYTPTLNYDDMTYEYSAWDIFYAPYGAGNYPDLFAPYGGYWNGSGWVPETRTAANTNANGSGAQTPSGGFSASPRYNPSNPLAFWDTRNPTLTQYAAPSAFVIGPDISGNIYTYSETTKFVLQNSPDYGGAGIGTVILQLQTDGNLLDFGTIRLVYNDGFNDIAISAADAEYLREYGATGSTHWSASSGYTNRLAIQWDLTGLTDSFGNPIEDYEIYFAASSSSVSLQKVDLITTDTYDAGIPLSATWTGGSGAWSDAANWSIYRNGEGDANAGVALPEQNGNIRFANTAAATVALDTAGHAVGELVFQSPESVTIDGGALTSNTGVTTRAGATGIYTIDSDFALGAVNFFEINDGTVVMNGVISGAQGIVKSGAGTLVLAGDNTFTQFLGIQDGTVRVEGANAYSGNTTVLNGRLVVAADAGSTGALGSSASAISLGADAGVYSYAGGSDWLAELIINGDHTISRDVSLAAGDFAKRLGVTGAAGGATFSGAVQFSGASANPDDTDSAAGNVFLTAAGAADRLTFSGAMTGGATGKTVTLDGAGTVVFAGPAKTYSSATVLRSGTLLLAAGSGYAGGGGVTVSAGATLRVDGTLGGGGALTLAGGTLAGSGTVNRAFSVAGGAMLAPGDDGAGVLRAVAVTWGGGGVYLWEIGDGGWDLLDVAGALTITATSAAPFEIRVVSLGLEGFDGSAGYSWTLAEADGISGFDAAAFRIDTSGFARGFDGAFRIEREGSSLVLAYAPVPEPSAWALAAASGLFLFLTTLRGRLRPASPKDIP